MEMRRHTQKRRKEYNESLSTHHLASTTADSLLIFLLTWNILKQVPDIIAFHL